MSSSNDNKQWKASVPGKIATREAPGHSPSEQGQLHLLTLSTPNGQKVQIALEELVLHYGASAVPFTWDFIPIAGNDSTAVQKSPWFLKANPNGRIPTLVDHSKEDLSGLKGDDAGFKVFESAAILLYLAKEYDADDVFGFKDELERNECLQWIYFVHGGVGPMQGQYNHFNLYAPEKLPYAIKRYREETLRLYGVLEGRLSGKFTGTPPRQYLAGRGTGKYSWADINAYGWVYWHARSGIEDELFDKEFPELKKWLERLGDREGVKRGVFGYE